jgi:hypothetical protein
MLQGLQLWLPISKSVDEPIHAWPDIFNSGEAARLYDLYVPVYAVKLSVSIF